MAEEKVAFQSKEYKFPKYVWFTCFFVINKKGQKFPIFDDIVETSEEKVVERTKKFMKPFLHHKSVKEVVSQILVVKLKFLSLYPLKKELWDEPTIDVSSVSKAEILIEAMGKSKLYKYVVTPSYHTDKTRTDFKFAVAFTFLKGTENDIETFMKMSKHPVFPQAKHAGIYELEEIYGFDLEQNLRIQKEEEKFVN